MSIFQNRYRIFWLPTLNLAVPIILANVLAFSSFFIAFHQNHIFPTLSKALRILSGSVPIPVGQILVVVLILFIVLQIIHSVLRKKLVWLLNQGALFLGCMYWIFMVFWGFNYHYNELKSAEEKQLPNSEELIQTTHLLLQMAHQHRNNMTDAMRNEPKVVLIEQAGKGYKNLQVPFRNSNGILNYEYPSIKPVLFSEFMSYLGIGGIYFPFTGEANLNVHQPGLSIPFTACHEIAHQLGYAREDEANFIGFLATQQSSSIMVRYSGLLAAFRYCMNELYFADNASYYEVRESIPPVIADDLNQLRSYWNTYDGNISGFSNEVNDLFLKSNYQENGIESYDMFVLYLTDYYQKK